MQNWDKNRQDVKFKQKLNNVKSTLPKISYANGAGPSIMVKKPSSTINNQNLNHLENLYMNVTYKKKQGSNLIGSNPSSSPPHASSQQNSIPVLSKKKNTDMKHQNYLKHLLKEFGLSQYLRKLYELGYDDNNINRIGLMNRKSFQELMKNLKMFPGQSIKLEKLYDYLKQLNLAKTMYNTRLLGNRANNRNIPKKPLNDDLNKRRINTASPHNKHLANNNVYRTNNNTLYPNNNYNSNNQFERPKTSINFKMKPLQKLPNNYKNNSSNKIKSKTIDNNYFQLSLSPNSILNNQNDVNNDKNKTNNILLNSFKKGDLGYRFYLNNINNNFEETKNQKCDNNNIYIKENKPINCQKDVINNNYNSENTKEYNKYENINSLPSLNIKNDNNNNNDGDLIEEKMTENIDNMLKCYMVQLNEKLDDTYGSIEDSSLSYNVSLPFPEPDSNSNNNNNKEEKKSPNSENVKLPNIKDKPNSNKEQKTEKSNVDIKPKEKQILKNQRPNDKMKGNENKDIGNNSNMISNISKISDNLNKKEESKNDSFIDDIILDDNSFHKQKENHENNTEAKKEENIPIANNNKVINNIQNLKESKEKDIDENIEVIEDKKDDSESEVKYGFHGEKTDSNKNIQQETQNGRYSLEENIYDNLRLTKSSGEDYLQQNMEKFDIEYMCRCLSLAIMKLLESSKGKQHITDIMEKENEKFEFFNNLFNSNMNIISDFFGKNKDNNQNDQKLSNLEQLEINENKTIDDNNDITFLKHIKKDIDNKLLKEQEIKDKQFKLKNNLADIEKDIKFIDEFFSMGRKKVKNYQNISEKSKNILNKELSYINEVDSENNNTNKTNSTIGNMNDKNNSSKHSVNENSNIKENANDNEIIKEEAEDKNDEEGYDNDFEEDNKEDKNKDKEEKDEVNKEINNKFSSISNMNNNQNIINSEENKGNEDDINQNLKIDDLIRNNNEQIKEDLPNINQQNDTNNNKEIFESGSIESDYVIDVNTMDKFKSYLLKQAEVFDDDFIYSAMHIPARKYVPPPDPQVVFEFCANIMILTKMEKEVIIITLLYLERFIFNTGLLLTSRNWRRIIFITMAIASKIWDDDSFENNHFAQVFKHLSIGEINLLERTFLELIDYKVFVKCSEYFKYFFIIKSIALKYNYNGVEMIPISVERMMKIQEYAYQMQKRVKKKINLSNSTKF